ncbi:alkaline phosphatase [Burkholderia sp. MSh2]|uniref:Alkaline phosphatase n=1 Tax=Burkholderia paludis TaxID=1506587 RepID=A0A6J5DQT3_9BURK|nr:MULTISPECIES: alkaline phosphatase [Burkholderia]KEZ07478.1 alkaline phosphatase [Burkholderia sp. MSh2]CAB3755947.1 Alkaline phosphatase H [Burkholderia paludis]VWB59586.1 alkaline phosphatase [Burkholderia paludis]
MSIIKCIAAALAVAGFAGGPAQAAGQAKNVIFFLGDGMGPTTVTASRIYKAGESGQLTMEKLARTARVKTFSNDAQTTDSAPSMAAYMTGVKMNNEVLSMSSDTRAVAPGSDANGNKTVNNCAPGNGQPAATLLELAKARGKAVGAITTTELTHATPAATFSHICHRDAQYDIAAQAAPGGAGYNAALGDGVDVLMGGGRNHWTPFDPASNKRGRADGRNLLAEMKTKGYTVVATKDQLAQAGNGKLIGLFSSTSHLEYELDRVAGKGEGPSQPSLAEMTSKAIDVLSKNSNGYFLMVEGGRIDHALHGTNAKRALEDTVAFDEAIRVALSKVDLSNTLIVVTADHDHTMTINGYSKRGNPILDISRNYRDGQPSKDADGNTYTTLVFGNGANRPNVRTSVDSATATHEAYLQEVGVRMGSAGSETHGGGDVMLFADGADAKAFKGTIDNTKVFGLVRSAFGF